MCSDKRLKTEPRAQAATEAPRHLIEASVPIRGKDEQAALEPSVHVRTLPVARGADVTRRRRHAAQTAPMTLARSAQSAQRRLI